MALADLDRLRNSGAIDDREFRVAEDKFAVVMQPFGGTILETSLSDADEKELPAELAAGGVGAPQRAQTNPVPWVLERDAPERRGSRSEHGPVRSLHWRPVMEAMLNSLTEAGESSGRLKRDASEIAIGRRNQARRDNR